MCVCVNVNEYKGERGVHRHLRFETFILCNLLGTVPRTCILVSFQTLNNTHNPANIMSIHREGELMFGVYVPTMYNYTYCSYKHTLRS